MANSVERDGFNTENKASICVQAPTLKSRAAGHVWIDVDECIAWNVGVKGTMPRAGDYPTVTKRRECCHSPQNRGDPSSFSSKLMRSLDRKGVLRTCAFFGKTEDFLQFFFLVLLL